MGKQFTITLDDAVFERMCGLVGRDDDKFCTQYIEELVRRRVTYAPSGRDTFEDYPEKVKAAISPFDYWPDTVAEEKAAQFQQRMRSSFDETFDEPELEAEFRQWLDDGHRAQAADEQREARAMALLEWIYRAKLMAETRPGEALAWVQAIADQLGVGDEEDAPW